MQPQGSFALKTLRSPKCCCLRCRIEWLPSRVVDACTKTRSAWVHLERQMGARSAKEG
jgi:hypothetical protein